MVTLESAAGNAHAVHVQHRRQQMMHADGPVRPAWSLLATCSASIRLPTARLHSPPVRIRSPCSITPFLPPSLSFSPPRSVRSINLACGQLVQADRNGVYRRLRDAQHVSRHRRKAPRCTTAGGLPDIPDSGSSCSFLFHQGRRNGGLAQQAPMTSERYAPPATA